MRLEKGGLRGQGLSENAKGRREKTKRRRKMEAIGHKLTLWRKKATGGQRLASWDDIFVKEDPEARETNERGWKRLLLKVLGLGHRL